MSHHIDDQGRFQSDLFPDLAPDKIVLSFKDAAARLALKRFADMTQDRELAEDIKTRLKSIQKEL